MDYVKTSDWMVQKVYFGWTLFYHALDIITEQLNSRISGLCEVVSMFSVLQASSLQNLSDGQLLEEAITFDGNIRNI